MPARGTRPSTPDRHAHAIMDALRRTVRALRQSARRTETTLGISAAQLFVLHEIAGGGGESINALAERTLTDQSSVSLVVTRLEQRGLVARRDSRDDRRRTGVVVTAAGRRLLARAPEVTQVRLLGALVRMSAVERTTLARLLAALVDAIEETDAVPPMFFEDDVRRMTDARPRRRRGTSSRRRSAGPRRR
jgi:DNA-binding MarR family transcriptional regulator